MSVTPSSLLNTNCSDSTYTCGTCKSRLPSLMLLHQHLLNHGSSYQYNDVIKVAFTVHESMCKATQTDDNTFPETDFGSSVGKTLTQVHNAEHVRESFHWEENDKVITELSGSQHLLKTPSNSDILSVTNIADMEAENDDSVSDVCSNESGSAVDLQVISEDVKNVSEMVEASNKGEIIKTSTRWEMNETSNRGAKVETSKRGKMVETSNIWEMVKTSNIGESVETSSSGNTFETVYKRNTVITKTEDAHVDSERDTEKQNTLFYGKISFNNYIVQRNRPRGEFNFGERDEFMRVNVCKTWVPRSFTTQDEDGDGKASKGVGRHVHEQVSVHSDSSQNHKYSTSKQSTNLSDEIECFSPSVPSEGIGIHKGIEDSSGNSSTVNEILDIGIVECNLNEGNDDVRKNMSVSDGIPINASQRLSKTSYSSRPFLKQRFCCSKCGNSYRNKSSLEYHMNNHLGKKPYLCQGCGRTFASKKTLSIHWLHHHVEKQFECKVCHIKLPSAARLREHASTHTGMQDYTFTCPVCNKMYKSARYLRQHVQYSHKMNKKECKICCKVFSSFKEYTKHKTNCSRTSFVCEVCKNTFSSYGSLRRHGAIHTNHRPHECHVCYRKFLQKGPYWIHMLKHHDLTKEDLIQLFPDRHADRHIPRVAEKVSTSPVPKYEDKNYEYAENI